MLKSTCPKHDVHTLQAEKGSADISWGYSDPYGESVLPFLLFRIGLTISVPVLSISHAKLCISQRKALHPPTQSIATANAKHCICQRKALHLPTQSFATANAKLCIRQRKALHPPTHSFWSFGLTKLFIWNTPLHRRAKGKG